MPRRGFARGEAPSDRCSRDTLPASRPPIGLAATCRPPSRPRLPRPRCYRFSVRDKVYLHVQVQARSGPDPDRNSLDRGSVAGQFRHTGANNTTIWIGYIGCRRQVATDRRANDASRASTGALASLLASKLSHYRWGGPILLLRRSSRMATISSTAVTEPSSPESVRLSEPGLVEAGHRAGANIPPEPSAETRSRERRGE